MMAIILEVSSALAALIQGFVANNAEEERIALLRIQRVASNELARRESNE